jgi:hypothetical protein
MKKSPLRQRVTPSVPFMLAVEDESGKQQISLQLAYDFNSFALIEEQLGKSMLTDVGELLDNPTARSVSVLLWAACPDLSRGRVRWRRRSAGHQEPLLTVNTAKEALNACSAAYVKQLPADKVEKLKEIQRLQAAGEAAPPLAQSPAPTE